MDWCLVSQSSKLGSKTQDLDAEVEVDDVELGKDFTVEVDAPNNAL